MTYTFNGGAGAPGRSLEQSITLTSLHSAQRMMSAAHRRRRLAAAEAPFAALVVTSVQTFKGFQI